MDIGHTIGSATVIESLIFNPGLFRKSSTGFIKSEAKSTSITPSQNIDPLDELERILSKHDLDGEDEEAVPVRPGPGRSKKSSSNRAGLLARLKPRRKSTAGSSTDARDDEVCIPSCDVVLDNTRVAQADPDDTLSSTASRSRSHLEDDEIWKDFKTEILKLTHTLKLRRWGKVDLDRAEELQVKRLSGALTNAVYVVLPPPLTSSAQQPRQQVADEQHTKPILPPPKLLLRIYGPQVEYLIDREKELEILRRLSKQNIGPRMLGTFKNGRFEQFLPSQTLTAADLRNPQTSMQIGKRMKELHIGIELLDEEREAGPSVWKNWSKWTERAEEVVSWADRQVRDYGNSHLTPGEDTWKSRGYVCGTEWPAFRHAVERYHSWLDERVGGGGRVADGLVFAHSDAIIDFEYAGPNPIAIEFANHFSEWCYDYSSPTKPWAFHASRFPTTEEQYRLVSAYVSHDPGFGPLKRFSSVNTIGYKPALGNSSVTSFLLEGRADPSLEREELSDLEDERDSREVVNNLLLDAQIWRPANSAHWIAWGIIQANLPEMGDPVSDIVQEQIEEKQGFDYLGYARDRALFFWGDLLQLGIINEAELPSELKGRIKMVPVMTGTIPNSDRPSAPATIEA